MFHRVSPKCCWSIEIGSFRKSLVIELMSVREHIESCELFVISRVVA